MTTAPKSTADERRAARAAADLERIKAAGRAAGDAAGPLPPDIAARVAAVLARPDRSSA